MSFVSDQPIVHVHQTPWLAETSPSFTIVGISVFCILVAAFYCLIGLFLGHRIAEIAVNTVFSFAAVSVALLFLRCVATDPSDKIRSRFRKKKQKGIPRSSSNNNTSSDVGVSKQQQQLNYRYISRRILLRFFKRVDRKILRTCIRRKYLDPWNTMIQIEPLIIPFPLVLLHHDDDSSLTPHPKKDVDEDGDDNNNDDVSFCSLCDLEVNRYSKHCRTCNRCVEGFDQHCRWLNNCIGKKNYTTFILLMMFVLIMLIVEGGAAIAVFVRCFADSNGIQRELSSRHYHKFTRGLLAALSILLVLLTTYSTAALGQLFFFHVLLIRKGISTYDYILAMKEENMSMELESSLEDSSSDDDDDDEEEDITDSPQKPAGWISRITCIQNPEKLAIRIDGDDDSSSILNKKSQFRASIDPWKLINLSREKALTAAEKAGEKLRGQLMPLPLETRSGLHMKSDIDLVVAASKGLGVTPSVAKGMLLNSPRQISSSSPRRRGLTCSPPVLQQQQQQYVNSVPPSPKHGNSRYRSNFDLKLTQFSREADTYISKQVLCSVWKNDGRQSSPR
ncbi:hypothetical protein OROGR_024775 [Orobanche gracilis]